MDERKCVLTAFGVIWVVGLGVGMQILFDYENSSGPPATPPLVWPANSQLQRAQGGPTLVVIAQPHCPCTRATIGELALIMARLQHQVSATVVFSRPRGASEDWEDTDLWHSAAAIPGVIVMHDVGAVEAARFDASVSGQTLLYDASGRLVFGGAITASRGHPGRAEIISLVTQRTGEQY